MTENPAAAIPGAQAGAPPRGEPGGAALGTDAGQPVLRFVRRLAHPPAKVWRAITEPGELERWFPAVLDAERKAGAPITFTFGGGEMPPSTGEIVQFDPPQLFAFTWGSDVLRFELVPDGDGCVLHFSHTLGGGQPWSNRLGAPRQAAGWDLCLAKLPGAQAPELPSWLALDQWYLEAFGVADGEVRENQGGYEGSGRYEVRFERDLVRPAAAVWDALTGGDHVGTDVPARAQNPYVPAGAVTVAEPPRVLEYAWTHDGESAGRVRWQLTGNDAGCTLVLTQDIPAGLAAERVTALAAWHTHLELFVSALHGEPRPWPHERTEALRHHYGAQPPSR